MGQEFRSDVVAAVSKNLNLPRNEVENLLEKPPEGIGADLSLPCFSLAKKLKKDPKEIAREFSEKAGPLGLIRSIKSTGPYVNFFADWARLGDIVLKESLTKNYGKSQKQKQILFSSL